jgi:periplasmic copper chaperone A
MKKVLFFALVWAAALPAVAQTIAVSSAWARATVPGQHGTGAFMTLMAADGARLTGAASAVAGVVEIHEMKIEGNVMKMRAISAIDLPPGRSVQLAPGGYHVMLMDLKRALKPGDKILVELQFETRDKRLLTQPVEVEVRTAAPAAQKSGEHKH